MKTVYLYIKRYWGYVSKETNKTWIKAAEKVADEIKNMVTSTEQGTNRIAQEFSGLGTKIQNSIGNLYNIGYNAAIHLQMDSVPYIFRYQAYTYLRGILTDFIMADGFRLRILA